MLVLRKILGSRYLLWALLALPLAFMVVGLSRGTTHPGALLHPTGEFSARFMIIAMMVTPLRLMFPKARWCAWLLRHRRHFGVAAFGYAVAHTILYLDDMGSLKTILAEIFAFGIWTGWAAFAIFLPLGLSSNNASRRVLRSWWKPLQRWVYLAALLTLLHWIFVHNNLGPALVHFIPLGALEVYRIWKMQTSRRTPAAVSKSGTS